MVSNFTRKATYAKESVSLYLVDNVQFERLQQLGQFDFLTCDQLARTASMSAKRAREYQLSRWLLHHALIRNLPDSEKLTVEIRDQSDLPPYSPQAVNAGLYFSISHSANLVGVAISKVGPIGLDLEYRGKFRGYLETAQQFCSGREMAALEAAESLPARAALFYQLWTQKEAYLKSRCLGIGSMPMAQIEYQKEAEEFDSDGNHGSHVACFCHDHFQIAIARDRPVSVDLIKMACDDGVVERSSIQLQVDQFFYAPERNSLV